MNVIVKNRKEKEMCKISKKCVLNQREYGRPTRMLVAQFGLVTVFLLKHIKKYVIVLSTMLNVWMMEDLPRG